MLTPKPDPLTLIQALTAEDVQRRLEQMAREESQLRSIRARERAAMRRASMPATPEGGRRVV
jgi:hypothetical protein